MASSSLREMHAKAAFNRLWLLSILRLIGFFLCCLIMVLMIAQIAFYWVENSQGIEFIIILLAGFWLYLFRHALPQFLRLSKDAIAIKHSESVFDVLNRTNNVASIVERSGFGILSLTHTYLQSTGKSVLIDHLQDNIPPMDGPVDLYTLPNSQAIVLIETPEFSLEPRELSLLRLIQKGMPDKLIARELSLSPSTIRSYNSALFKKLDVSSREEAVTVAIKKGFISQG